MTNKKMHQKMTLFISAFLSLFLINLSQSVVAQIAPSPCDPDYYESLQSRAWLEAQREITQNQNFIRKPDSVLQYTCFDQYINIINTEIAGVIQSQASLRWGAPDPNLSTATLDGLLMVPMAEYLQGNFGLSGTVGGDAGYTLLGGYATTDLGSSPNLNSSERPINQDGYYNYTDLTTPFNRSYACDVMNVVWEAMRCSNFIENPDTQGFFTLEEYVSFTDDLRQVNYGGSTRTCGGPSGLTSWSSSYETALGINQVAGTTQDVPWTRTPVTPYRANFNAPAAPNTCSDSPRFQTGLTVSSPAFPNGYPETVCTMAGCIFDPSAGTGSGGDCVPGS